MLNLTTEKELETQIKQLQEQTQFYKMLIDNTMDWEVFRNSQGKILYVNKAFEHITGFSQYDLINGTINEKDVVHPDDWLLVAEAIKKSVQKQIVSDLQFKIVRKDKIIRYINLSATPVIVNEEFIGIRTSARDITAQHDFLKLKELDLALREKDKMFKIYIEKSPIAIFIVNDKGRYTFANSAAFKLLKYSHEELLQLTIPDILSAENQEKAIDNFSKLKDLGFTENNEFELVCKDGSLIYVILDIVQISPKEYISFVKDITERKAMELTLKEQNEEYLTLNEEYKAANEELNNAKNTAQQSEQQFKELFENMEQGFALHKMVYNQKNEPIDYVFLMTNHSFEQITGLNARQIIGKTVRSVLPKIEDIWIENYGKVASTRIPMQFESYSEDFDRYFNVTAYSPTQGYFAVIFTDVTENKKYQRDLILAKNAAEESNSLKTAFLQNMSHEIRTPMNAIMGFTSMLSKPDLREEKRNSFVKIIQNSANQLLSIVNDVLTMSALETNQEKINIEECNVNQILTDLLSIFKKQIENENVRLFLKPFSLENQANIKTDKTKLTKILSNLLSNAIKFTHHGNIEFGYTLEFDSAKPMLQFYVKDTGIGIKPEIHDKIFERFRQAELSVSRQYGGAGLGLSICKGFVNLLGGKIWLESKLDSGSTFYFTIPYISTNEILTPNQQPMPKEYDNLILVAEDEEYNYLYIEEILLDYNVLLIHARNGQEVMDYLNKNNSIDLILMDIKMPIIDGYTCTKMIKEKQPKLPIIAQSAYALEHEIRNYKPVFDDYVTKPINIDELLTKIQKYIQLKPKKN